MSFPPHVPAQILDFAARVKFAVGGFFRKVAEKAAKLRVRIQLFIDELLLRLPVEKRRLVLIASVGGLVVVVLVFTGIASLARAKPASREPAAAVSIRQEIIPPDELFLPNEPDFVPGIILEREQRSLWTADDAEPLWQDPLKNGEEPWRNRIEKTIDEIMESVP